MENQKKKMVFLAHWVEGWNLLLFFSGHLRRKPEHAWMYAPLFPLCWFVSLFWFVGNRAFDVVDEFCFGINETEEVEGRTVLIRNFGLHFFLPSYRPKIQKRILIE